MPNVPISSLPLTTTVCSNALVPIVQNGVTFSTYACLVGGSGGGGCGGGNVTKLIAGTGVEISPSSGTGNVTVCVTGGGGTGNIDCLIAGCGIVLSPSSGVGDVTICNTLVTCSPMSGQFGQCTIVGNAFTNTIPCNSPYSFIGGGCNNNIEGGQYSVLAGGFGNKICNSSCYSFVFGSGHTLNNSNFSASVSGFGAYSANCSFMVVCLCSCGTIGIAASTIGSGLALCFSCDGIGANAGAKFAGYQPACCGQEGVIVYGNGFCAPMRCGVNNDASGCLSSLIGGCNNKTTGYLSFISASSNSCDNGYGSVYILGLDSFVAPQGNTTYVNNIAPQGLSGVGCPVGVSSGFLTSSLSTTPALINSCGCCSLSLAGTGNCACNYSFSAAGNSNVVSASFSSILGGNTNNVSSNLSTIGGGCCNNIVFGVCNSCFNFIGGGSCNAICACDNCNVGNIIGGGSCNTISGNYSSIIGGNLNFIRSDCSVIGGGDCNIICCSNYSFIGGGQCNRNCLSTASIIVGGCQNRNLSSPNSFIQGGSGNGNEDTNYSTISGGYQNINQFGCYNLIMSGSLSNITCGRFNSVVGGRCHVIQRNCYSIILNGLTNTIDYNNFSSISSNFNSIMNGYLNYTNSSYALIGNGFKNQICGLYSCNSQGKFNTILNGKCNTIETFTSSFSTINNGVCNVINGNFGEITGGCLNTINGNFSYIGVGNCNTICGNFSTIIGGSCNITCANYAGIFGCNIVNNTACSFMSNQLRARNLLGAGAICANANGVIVPVSSDLRLKKDIKEIDYGLKEINSLNPISYYWSDEYQNKNGYGRKIGFIAQEVKEIIPEAIFETEDNLYGFDEKALSPIITKSLQELESQLSLIQIKLNSIRN